MAVTSSKDFLLAFLYAPGSGGEVRQSIRGITRFEKLVFLALRDKHFAHLIKGFGYKPDSYGPFSDRLQDDLEGLSDIGLVQKKPLDVPEMPADELHDAEGGEFLSRPVPLVFKLTDLGVSIAGRIWDTLEPVEREAIACVKSEFNRLPLDRLLSHVYITSASEWTSKSVVKDKYLHRVAP